MAGYRPKSAAGAAAAAATRRPSASPKRRGISSPSVVYFSRRSVRSFTRSFVGLSPRRSLLSPHTVSVWLCEYMCAYRAVVCIFARWLRRLNLSPSSSATAAASRRCCRPCCFVAITAAAAAAAVAVDFALRCASRFAPASALQISACLRQHRQRTNERTNDGCSRGDLCDEHDIDCNGLATLSLRGLPSYVVRCTATTIS